MSGFTMESKHVTDTPHHHSFSNSSRVLKCLHLLWTVDCFMPSSLTMKTYSFCNEAICQFMVTSTSRTHTFLFWAIGHNMSWLLAIKIYTFFEKTIFQQVIMTTPLTHHFLLLVKIPLIIVTLLFMYLLVMVPLLLIVPLLRFLTMQRIIWMMPLSFSLVILIL